ncbi:uncharacterized protein LOC117174919 isoform X2 [Belonocnema kinseyi]|uniref:uncharacterized protein LOC117174919 isoform X2 n=1 Tax=Belonocnema kinseyi TaxID=2817044 RepID=UPI00143D4599|nr:uncharacterized protein LOC117174919 isoform X2 [Belonocnema kinseyi]
MSKISILLYLSAINLILSDAFEFQWAQNGLSTGLCKEDQQPIVEYFSFHGKQYLLFSQRVTWEEARILCTSYDAKLAILNDIEKANGVAEALADSNIATEDIWLGARRLDAIWTWIDNQETAWRKNILSIEPDVDNYPPWSREPTRPTKECLGMDRKSHSYPNFVDLDCRLLRPFICEKKSEDSLKSPVPSKWIQIHRSTYTLYHGKVTWDEAATFCRKQGARLAIIKNLNVIEILTNSMTKTRPDFETVWIGAHFSYGQWIWMATGAILNSIAENGFPPWRSGRSQKNEGCLLLDRHLGGHINFIESSCDRKRDFVCEEYPQEEHDDWLNDPVKFSHENKSYIIYSLERTWEESNDFCKERGSVLAYMEDMNTTELIIEAMGDHPKAISHVWIGGVYNANLSQWTWNHNNRRIPSEKDRLGFPPWTNTEGEFDFYNEASTCLNLDRSDHVKAHLYGLDCSNKQPFVCKITCNVPPEVKNGNWTCESDISGNKCTMECKSGFIMMGLKNATCSNYEGWASANNWLEFPVCMKPSEYTNRLVRSLGYEVQKIVGYYFILDHWNEKMKQLSIQFAEQLLTIFPINRHLKMGMASYITNPSSHLNFNQTDNCLALQTIRGMKNKISANGISHENSTDSWFKEISVYTGRKTLIVAIIDRYHAKKHGDVWQQLISAGHRVAIIGSKEDGEVLLPLVTVGLEKKVNLFLFDSEEFESVIKEMNKIKGTIRSKCPQNLETPTTENTKSTISSGTFAQTVNKKPEMNPNISNSGQVPDFQENIAEMKTIAAKTIISPTGTTGSVTKAPETTLIEVSTANSEIPSEKSALNSSPRKEVPNKESANEETKTQPDSESVNLSKEEQNNQTEDQSEHEPQIYSTNEQSQSQLEEEE